MWPHHPLAGIGFGGELNAKDLKCQIFKLVPFELMQMRKPPSFLWTSRRIDVHVKMEAAIRFLLRKSAEFILGKYPNRLR